MRITFLVIYLAIAAEASSILLLQDESRSRSNCERTEAFKYYLFGDEDTFTQRFAVDMTLNCCLTVTNKEATAHISIATVPNGNAFYNDSVITHEVNIDLKKALSFILKAKNGTKVIFTNISLADVQLNCSE